MVFYIIQFYNAKQRKWKCRRNNLDIEFSIRGARAKLSRLNIRYCAWKWRIRKYRGFEGGVVN
jgi:hypothetical protein